MAVPAILATGRVLGALRARLLGDAALVARLADAPAAVGGGPGIYTEGAVPSEAEMDYLTIGSFTERDDSTMGDEAKWGSELTAMIKLFTMSRDIGHALGTMDRLMALLHGTPLTVADYAAGSVMLSLMVDAYEESLSGRMVTHYPSLWTVRVSQVP
jgi:hypothetical protein